MSEQEFYQKQKIADEKKAGTLYTFKVYLIAGMIIDEEYEGKEISRRMQLRGDQTLDMLHQVIFQGYERIEEHLYAFFIGKGLEKQNDLTYPPPDFSMYDIYEPHYGLLDDDMAITKDSETPIADLQLEQGDAFIYVFDFGDQWLHAIILESIDEVPADQPSEYPRIIESIGKAPPQYPEIVEESFAENFAGSFNQDYQNDFQEIKMEDLDEFIKRFIKPDSNQ